MRRVRRRAAVPGIPALLAARIAPVSPSVLDRAYTVRSRSVACPTDRQATLCLPHCGFARVAGNGVWDPFRYAWFTETGTDGKRLSDRELRKGFNAVKRDVYPWSTDLCPHVGPKTIRPMADGLNRRGRTARPARPAGLARGLPEAPPAGTAPVVSLPEQAPHGARGRATRLYLGRGPRRLRDAGPVEQGFRTPGAWAGRGRARAARIRPAWTGPGWSWP